jgi:hypothetical protein
MNWSDLKSAFGKVFQSITPIYGSGTVETVSIAATDFDHIVADGGFALNITQSGKESVTVTTDNNILPYLTIEVVERVLYLKPKPDVNLHPSALRYEVQCQALHRLLTNGSAEVTLNQIGGTKLVLESNGSGRLSCQGTVESLGIEINGTGSCSARELTAHTVTVAIAGSGEVAVSAAHTLSIVIRGAGNVTYWGNPTVEQVIQGAGRVTKG